VFTKLHAGGKFGTGSYAAAFLNGLAWNALNVGIILTLLLRGRPRLVAARA